MAASFTLVFINRHDYDLNDNNRVTIISSTGQQEPKRVAIVTQNLERENRAN